MFVRALKQVRDLIRARQYVMTLHAEDEMTADDLAVYDVESVVLTGQIVERQKDRISGQWKYLISGQSLVGDAVTVVFKFGPTGRRFSSRSSESRCKNDGMRHLWQTRRASPSRFSDLWQGSESLCYRRSADRQLPPLRREFSNR